MKQIAVEGDGALAAAVATALTAIGWRVERDRDQPLTPIVMIVDLDVAALLVRVRRADARVIIVIVDGKFAATDRHLLLAAIEPLAVECAPQCRVSAIEVRPGANPVDVAATIAYMIDAASVTGQVIRVDPRESAMV